MSKLNSYQNKTTHDQHKIKIFFFTIYLEISVCQASSNQNGIDELELDDIKHHIFRKKSNLLRKQRYSYQGSKDAWSGIVIKDPRMPGLLH